MTNLFEQMDSKASTAGGSETTRACLSLCDIVKPVAATAEQCNKSAEDRAFELLSQESSKELSITSAAQKSAAVGVKQADACFESNYFLPSHKDAGIERMSLLAQSVNTGDGRAEPVSTQLATYGDYQMQKSAKNDSPQSIVDGIPNITGLEREVEKVTSSGDRLFAPDPHALDGVRSSFANALHMQQPMIPAGAGDLQHAPLVSNLQYMFDHINEGDNHNAPDFINCYSRMGDFITELVKDGKSPRIMLDYSGDLLWGLEQMGRTDVLDNLRKLACDPKYNHDVEFLGTMWSHAVAPSTPVPDLKLQIRAWQDHFASLFGTEALSRVRGFSPPEMALPNNPDVAYSYIKDLKDCGYRWLLVQEDTVENLDGSHVTDQHLPHMMVVRNSSGEEISMPVLIKTQGSDTKLVGQMQPLSEALTMQRQQLNGKSVPALVAQIGDGENGGVMMNEFPKIFMDKMSHLPADVPALNGTEYLERLADLGVTDKDFARVEPKGEAELWKHFSGSGRDALNKAIEATSKDDPRFTMDGGSWTDDRSWVNGYKDVLDDINKLSARFHEVFDGKKVDPEDKHYRTALMYLLVAETSCYRYWGTGRWTDYAKEICRRGQEVLKQDK